MENSTARMKEIEELGLQGAPGYMNIAGAKRKPSGDPKHMNCSTRDDHKGHGMALNLMLINSKSHWISSQNHFWA